MIYKILKKIKILTYAHSSFLLISIGSLFFFVSNIYAKKFFNTNEFNEWIYIISLLSFFSSFAMMGQDQLLLRFSKIKKKFTIIDKFSLSIIFISLLLFSTISLTLFGKNQMGVSKFEIVLLLMLFSFCRLGYQLRRVNKNFLLAQLSLNGWKLLLICIILLTPIIGVLNLFLFSFGIGILIFLTSILRVQIGALKKKNIIFKYGTSYFLSTGVMAILVYFERFIIEGKIGINEYANFLYFFTISMSIYSILASYFGFKEAIKYKDNFDIAILNRDLSNVLKFLIPISCIWTIMIYFFFPILDMSIDIKSLILVSLIGILKCFYSILSSVMLIKMSYASIIKINLITISLLLLFFLFFNLIAPNINLLLVLIALTWIFRSSLIFFFIKNSFSS